MIKSFESPRQSYTKPKNGAEYNMATIFIRRRPDSVMEWAIEDVLDWLKELELERFCKRFQSHLVSGPILLQMDDTLLDDLHVTSNKERQLLLEESSRLCLQELELVDKALEYKQNTEKLSNTDTPKINNTFENVQNDKKSDDDIEVDSFIQNDVSTYDDIDVTRTTRPDNIVNDYPAACEPDEVATRATLMVTILSQEKSNLRAQLEQSCQKDQSIQTLEDEVSKLQAANKQLQYQVQEFKMENTKLSNELEELRCKYNELQEACKNNINKQECEIVVEQLRQENIFLREKFQRFKYITIEREVTRNLSNGVKMNTTQNTTHPKLQDAHLRGSHGVEVQQSADKTENNLQLIDKVYTANKRCAELEDTVRWLYTEMLPENNMHSTDPNIHIEEEEQAPSEPEWPSLVGRAPMKVANQEGPDEDFLNRFMTRGLPTDSDEDIWTRTDKTKNNTKSFEGSDASLLHCWNV